MGAAKLAWGGADIRYKVVIVIIQAVDTMLSAFATIHSTLFFTWVVARYLDTTSRLRRLALPRIKCYVSNKVMVNNI